jgi:hypothetical protein
MAARVVALGLAALTLAAPASARLWKPTPQEVTQDYTIINHNKGPEGRVVVSWMASALLPAPTMQQLLDKYVLVSVVHTRQAPGGGVTWDDVEGVQVSDASGTPLKEVPPDAVPPALVGITAAAEAAARQSTQGRSKLHWMVYEAGNVRACGPGKLQLTYDGETYSWDTPLPGCPQ